MLEGRHGLDSEYLVFTRVQDESVDMMPHEPMVGKSLRNFHTRTHLYNSVALNWCSRGMDTLESVMGVEGSECGGRRTVKLVPSAFVPSHRVPAILSVWEHGELLRVELLYDDGIFSDDFMTEFARRFRS